MAKNEKDTGEGIINETLPAKKLVSNRSGHRIELVNGSEVIVFLPGKITEVPMDFDIPNGLGLYVR